MDSKLIAVLSVAIAALVGISMVEAATNVAVCKDDPPRFISCPAQSTINIIDIVYGRKRNKCSVRWYKSCRSRTAETMTRNNCQGKRFCIIYGYRDGYGNPCSFPGADEYMDVTYECAEGSFAGRVDLDSYRSQKTPKNEAFFAPSDENVNNNVTTYVTSGVTKISDATKFAKHYCHGKTWCYAGANSASLSDPCSGISKYMEIVYECKAPSYFTTGPPTAPLFD
eukprot:gene15697-17280_t